VKTVLQKNRLYLYLLQNGYKSPKNNLIDLIYNFTNAYCEILCFKNVLQNGCCHFDEIGRENCFTCFSLFVAPVKKIKFKIENNVNYEIGRENCFTGYKYPKNNLIELIYNFTNAYCEILCFENVLQNCCRFDKIDHCYFDEIGHDESGRYESGRYESGRENCFTVFVVVFVFDIGRLFDDWRDWPLLDGGSGNKELQNVRK